MTYVQPIGYSTLDKDSHGKHTRRWPALAVSLLVLLAGGCVRSIQPILTDEQVIVDKSIAGKWVEKDGDSSLEISAPGEDKKFKVVYTEKNGKKGTFEARLGKIGDVLVAELKPDEPLPDASDMYKAHLLPLYSFLVVSKTQPDLVVSVMKLEWMKKHLDDNPKDLQFIKPSNDDFIITSPTADFQAFLAKHWKTEGAFGDPGTFVRPDAARPATAPAK